MTRVCFRNAVASKGGNLLLVSIWLQRLCFGSGRVGVCLYCTCVIPVEKRGHSPPGGLACDWDFLLSIVVLIKIVAGHIEESITLLLLTVLCCCSNYHPAVIYRGRCSRKIMLMCAGAVGKNYHFFLLN